VRVVRGFQAPAEKWLAGHRGVDLAGGPDAPVLAPADGTVTFNGWVVDRQVLVVAHGNLRTTLEPVVGGPPVGTQVAAGNVIGLVAAGQASHCDGCLHWGVRQGATYLDPVALVLPRHRAVLWE
jgi:murein DD-endopeptidase MepM/ murein hydrolase activator NlpD